MCNKAIKALILLFTITICISAKAMSEPGPSGTGTDGENSALVKSNEGLMNPLTGLSSYHLKLLSINGRNGFNVGVDFNYTGNIQKQLATPINDVDPSWCGVGWYMGYSSIKVDHKSTANKADDKWYYCSGEGTVSEIVFVNGKYQIKDRPYWTVTPHFDLTTTYQIIDGWTVISTDGYIYRYGDFNGTSYSNGNNAGRYLGCSANNIGNYWDCKFYYQWDLAEAEDLSGNKIKFTYQQFQNGCYIEESQLNKIENDIGDKIVFDLDRKDYNEIQFYPSGNFGLHDAHYLKAIRLQDPANNDIEKYDLKYTFSPNLPGRRFLSEITSTKLAGTENRFFSYDFATYPGYLTSIIAPATGKTIKYSYKQQNFLFKKADNTDLTYTIPLVDKVTQCSNIQNIPDIEDVYSYPSDRTKYSFDTASGIAYMGEVTKSSSNGKSVFKYEIDPSTHIVGALKQVDAYSGSNTLVSSVKNTYQPILFGTTANPWYLTEKIKEENITDGVSAISGSHYCAYNTTNGQLPLSYSVNSDNTAILTKNKFAYETQPAMGAGTGNANMLTQLSTVIRYKQPSFSGNCDLSSATVVNASNTQWSNETGRWRPKATYVWNVNKDIYGNPLSGYVDFNESQPTSNNWQLINTITRYNSYGKVVETNDPQNVKNVTIYRNDNGNVIGNVLNASFRECSAFTCDYKAGTESGYWDYENGWECGGFISALSTSYTHFGDQSLLAVDNIGAARKNLIIPGEEYIMSAWVFVVSGKVSIEANYQYAATGYENEWPQQHSVLDNRYAPEKVELSQSDCSGKWMYLQLKIPASKTSQLEGSKTWFAKTWIGTYSGGVAFIDDIRFYPSRAFMTTTYYDQKWRKPILTINENNKAGIKTVYDSYARPYRSEKVILNRNTSLPYTPDVVNNTEYHSFENNSTIVYSNGYETGNIGNLVNSCGTGISIISNGFNSAHCLNIVNNENCISTLNLDPVLSAQRVYVLKGYYKTNSETKISIKSGGVILKESLLPVSSNWIEFNIPFRADNSIQIVFSNTCDLKIDDIKIFSLQ